MGDSKIEWTDATWNPVTGCSKVSPGCAHCYAETISARFRITSKPWTPENAAENDGGRLPVDYGTGWEDYAHWEDGREVTDDLPELSLHEVDWLIVGGESGHGARRMDLAWARDIRDACKDAGVAFFMKQLGEVAARELGCRDRKGGDPSEWPADLRVREMPA
jgi:protein gp37